MRFLLRPLQWIYCIYALLLFICIMLLLFPFVLIASLFGNITGGNMIYRICMLWGDLWFFLIFIYHRNYYEQALDKSKQYIFVGNHISYLDAPIIVKTVRQPVRALGKTEIGKVPVFGFIYKYAVVRVDRSNADNRAKSVRNMRSVLKKNISIIVFPEGTFNMTNEPVKEFYDGAFRIAIETQTPIKPVLFLDSYTRLHYGNIFSLTPGKSRAVYLEETTTTGYTFADVAYLKEKIYKQMEDKLIHYNAHWIKTSTGIISHP